MHKTNTVWLEPKARFAMDRETGRERPFLRYAFKRIGDDPKVMHIGAIQTANHAVASAEILNRIGWPQALDGTTFYEEMAKAFSYRGKR